MGCFNKHAIKLEILSSHDLFGSSNSNSPVVISVNITLNKTIQIIH